MQTSRFMEETVINWRLLSLGNIPIQLNPGTQHHQIIIALNAPSPGGTFDLQGRPELSDLRFPDRPLNINISASTLPMITVHGRFRFITLRPAQITVATQVAVHVFSWD